MGANQRWWLIANEDDVLGWMQLFFANKDDVLRWMVRLPL